MIIATTTKPVYRHQQDTGMACGRACAQMIISSLGQAGSPAATIISVEQETLRTRESNKIDIEYWWFTEPDEFRDLLATAAELSAADHDWRVASHATADKLLADLILAMQAHGRPAAVTTGAVEHWMVLTQVHENSDGRYAFHFFNPLPSPIAANSTTGGPRYQHQFMDAECGTDQQPLIVVNRGSEIADLNLKIKGFTKPKTIKILSPAGEAQAGATLPPPSTVGSYTGKAVGVAFGPAPSTNAVTQLARTLKNARLSPLRMMSANPVDVIQSGLRTQFRLLTESFDLKPLGRTLAAPDLAVTATRQIDDVEQPGVRYVLASGYSEQTRTGFVAAFDASAKGPLLHVQITNDRTLINSLASFPGETLYWTTGPTSHFPPMAMPYFVFRKKPGQPGVLIRLYDDVEGTVIAAQCEGPGPA